MSLDPFQTSVQRSRWLPSVSCLCKSSQCVVIIPFHRRRSPPVAAERLRYRNLDRTDSEYRYTDSSDQKYFRHPFPRNKCSRRLFQWKSDSFIFRNCSENCFSTRQRRWYRTSYRISTRHTSRLRNRVTDNESTNRAGKSETVSRTSPAKPRFSLWKFNMGPCGGFMEEVRYQRVSRVLWRF